jgi:hypothetical protein
MAEWKKVLVSGSTIDVAALQVAGAAITSTPAELNLLDGVSGLVQGDFTKLAAINSTAAEIDVLDGVTAGTAAASKAVVLDSNKDLGTIRNISGSGALFSGTVNAAEFVGGGASITGIVNASVASNAAIADTKLGTIATANKVSLSALNIDGGTDIGAALADADLMIVDDGAGGTNRKATMSRLKTYMQNGLTFTTNTDTNTQRSDEEIRDVASAQWTNGTNTTVVKDDTANTIKINATNTDTNDDVSVANLKTRLASSLGTATIGDSNDTIVIAGNLTIQGTKTELQTTNLNVEDQFILLDSGSAGGADSGIIFGGSSDTTNSGYALAWDDSAGHFGISQAIASDATAVTLDGKLGYIETSTAVPSSAPTRQGVGSIHVKTDDETIWIYS